MITEAKQTLWKILDEYDAIEIPILQRDYAQGRNSPEVETIRNNFVLKLKEKLIENIPFDLNFVYGSVTDNCFAPIDGQQRLTTLFLLHWYLLFVTGELYDSKNARIKRFTYKTRISSADFCQYLTSKKIEIQKNRNIVEVPKLSIEIMNNSWFRTSWKDDPTISSMLTMIDTIHNEFKEYNNLTEILGYLRSDNCPLFFYFLDLGKYKLDDSIYIKLNARGIALTEFENFKAKLSRYLEKKNVSNSKELIEKLDIQWAYFFWNYKDQNSKLYDDKIMNLIMTFIINEYATSLELKGRDEIRNEMRDKLSYTRLDFVNKFEKLNNSSINTFCFEETIQKLFNLFDKIDDNGNIKLYLPENIYVDEAKLIKAIINGNESTKKDDYKEVSYTTRIKFYAYCSYLLNNESGDLTNWLRVIRTLSEETNYNGRDDFARALRGIRDMSSYSNDILSFLSTVNPKEFSSGFDEDCFVEECIKAKLILRTSCDWRTQIIDAENNPYFQGQIGVILDFAGIINAYKNKTIDNWSKEDEINFYNDFCKYKLYFENLFGEFELQTGEKYVGLNRILANSFRRALLSEVDYSLNIGISTSLLVDNERDISWKRLMRIQSNQKSYFDPKRLGIKKIFDNKDFDASKMKDSFEKICTTNLLSISESDWRYALLAEPEIMDHIIGYNSLKPEYRLLRFTSGTCFIMGSSRLYGYNDELNSYSVYVSLKKLGFECSIYNMIKGLDEFNEHFHVIINNSKYGIKFVREQKKFRITDDKNIETCFSSRNEVIIFFTNL